MHVVHKKNYKLKIMRISYHYLGCTLIGQRVSQNTLIYPLAGNMFSTLNHLGVGMPHLITNATI